MANSMKSCWQVQYNQKREFHLLICTRTICAVLVTKPGLKPHWNGSKTDVSSRYFWRCFATTFCLPVYIWKVASLAVLSNRLWYLHARIFVLLFMYVHWKYRELYRNILNWQEGKNEASTDCIYIILYSRLVKGCGFMPYLKWNYRRIFSIKQLF